MERLTERDEFGNADIIGVDSFALQGSLPFQEFNKVTAALNRLAAYEDTGLEPQGLDVELEYGDKKVHLRRCPFCGSAPLIHSYRNRMRLWYRIKCSNESEDCRMIPETSASRKLVEAAADWNQHGSRDAVLEEIWQQLTDIPMDPETERLEAPFYDWPAGTHREEIWRWFDERHSKGVAYLLYGTPNKTEGE